MDAYWIIFLFALGACVGSFLNVVIWRMPRGESIVFPGSHCPQCGRGIRWYDNIPLLSWLALRGRCRFCKVKISPRYLIIEFITALLVVGLYLCYYEPRLGLRHGAGRVEDTWPMYAAHAALVCALLVCWAVDVEHWIVPLEVCWVVSLVGIISSAAKPMAGPPYDWMPVISPATGAMTVAAFAGLAIAILLQRRGILQQSFLDASDKPDVQPKEDAKSEGKSKAAASKSKAEDSKPKARRGEKEPISVAFTKAHGVDPRREVLREVLFLAPALGLAMVAYYLVTRVPAFGDFAGRWITPSVVGPEGPAAVHVHGLLTAGFGYLIGGLWIWGTRIAGTLVFGKEAMGLGDVHILAAVGAVCGWIIPTIAFFVSPVLGLLWALYLLASRRQRELPYGPWLAIGSMATMIFYDRFGDLLSLYMRVLRQ